MLSYLFCHPITHICSAGEERKREKREKIVHLPLENGLPLYFYHRVTSTAVVSSSVVVIVVVLLSALANIAMHVCMCVPEISSLIVVRLHSRRICVVFISIFNISLLFCSFFLFFRILALFLHSCCAACLPCNQPRTTTDDNSFRISLPASPLLLLLLSLLLFLLLLFHLELLLLLLRFLLCLLLPVKEKNARARERERENPTCVTHSQPRSKNK